MSHLDEGTLHALLDGELDAKEVREIQAHLGSCSACGTRLQSVKEIAAETDRLVGVIQFPGTPRRPAALDPAPEPVRHMAPPPETGPEPEYVRETEFETPPAYEPPAPIEATGTPAGPRPRPAERLIGAEPVYHEAPPVLLVPDDNAWGERRRRMVLFTRWAALVFVAVGAGYIASEVRKGGAPVPSAGAGRLNDEPAAPVVSSTEETSRPESTLTARQSASPGATRAAPAPARPEAPKATPAPAAKAPANTAKNASAPPSDRADKLTAVGAFGTAADAAGADESQEAETAPAADEDDPVPPPNVREEAAEAMEELDRERRLERAAAATAALDREAKRRAVVSRAAAVPAETPAPAPAPRTLEQRSNIYLRIGLDEAARQLGRPVHVLEGMQQQFMGLAQGVASPAADATRPVVRVVYQDNQGRMILLDQQRIRPGQVWTPTETRWVVGEVGLALLGEPGPEILRNLRPRVR